MGRDVKLAIPACCLDRHEQRHPVIAAVATSAMEARPVIAGLREYEIWRIIEIFGAWTLLDREAVDRPADAQFKAPEALTLQIEDNLFGHDPTFVGTDISAAYLLSRRQKFITGGCWHSRLLWPGVARL